MTPNRSSEPSRDVSKRRRVPVQLRNVAFPITVRGYDRRMVDAYVTRVNRMIAELEATRAPETAVRRALERAERQRSRILERAREAANAITAGAEREAKEILAKARAEAVTIVVTASAEADRSRAEANAHSAKASADAEAILDTARTRAAAEHERAQEEANALREKAAAWARDLRRDTEALWAKRDELLSDLRAIAARLEETASAAAARAGSRDGPAS
jgi:DivIVA domain-containing protein